MAVCAICERRKGKRSCPAKRAKICSPCCGEHRERTLDCPSSCQYLQQAHHTEAGGFDPEQTPYREIHVDEDFLRRRFPLLAAGGRGVVRGARESGARDADARAALDIEIQRLKTLSSSGIVYEQQAPSAYVRSVAEAMRSEVEEFQRSEAEQSGITPTLDGDALKMAVFLRRLAEANDNGRPLSRKFLSFLGEQFPAEPDEPDPPGSLILPGR